MTWRRPTAEAVAWVDDLPADDWLQLARYLAPAVRIDQKIIRNLRLRYLPASDAGLESRLWWSPVVASRSALAISMQADVARALVDGADYNLGALETALTGLVDHWSPLAQLEQRCRFAVLRNDMAAVDDALRDVVKLYVQSDADARLKILSWCRAALPQITAPEDHSEAANWLAMLTSSAWGEREDDEPAQIANRTSTLPVWLSTLLPASESHAIGVRLYENSLGFTAPDDDGLKLALDSPLPGRLKVEVPDTEFTPRWETVYAGHAIALPAAARRVILTTLLGVRYELAPEAETGTAEESVEPSAANPDLEIRLWFDEPMAELAEQIAAQLSKAGFSRVKAEPWRDVRESGDPDLASFNTGANLHLAQSQTITGERLRELLEDLVPLRLHAAEKPEVTMFPGSHWGLAPDQCYLLVSAAPDLKALMAYVVAEFEGSKALDNYYFMRRIGDYERFHSYSFNWEFFRDLAGPLKRREASRPVFVIDQAQALEAPMISERSFPAPHWRLMVANTLAAADIVNAWLETLTAAGAEPTAGNDWFLEGLDLSPADLTPTAREFLGLAGVVDESPIAWRGANLTVELTLERHDRNWERAHYTAQERLRGLGLEVFDEFGAGAGRLLSEIRYASQSVVGPDAGLILLLRGYTTDLDGKVHFLVDEKQTFDVSVEALRRAFPGYRHLVVVIDSVKVSDFEAHEAASGDGGGRSNHAYPVDP